MLFAACWRRLVKPLTTVSGAPGGSSAPIFQCQRTTASFVAKYKYSPANAIPVPPPMPNDRTTSALPSPVVSRSSRTPPCPPPTETSRSPFSNTTRCRDGPIDSATISAQNPGWSFKPALSGAQTGLNGRGVAAKRNAVLPTRTKRVIEVSAGRELREYTAFRLAPTWGEDAVASCAVPGCSSRNISVATPCRAETGGRDRRRESRAVHAADGGSDLQLRRARISGNRNVSLPGRPAAQKRIHRARRGCRNSDRVGRDLGRRETSDLPRLRHRRHSAGLTETGRRLPCADDRRGARSRRGPQLRTGGEHHGSARRQEDSRA